MPRPSDPLRVVVERVTPQVDGGRFPFKASLGEPFVVEADVAIIDAGADVAPQLREGADLLEAAAAAVALDAGQPESATRLHTVAADLRHGDAASLDDSTVVDISLEPRTFPTHVRIRRRTRTENDFEYFT